MAASDELDRANELLAAGHPRRALRTAWRAADSALFTRDPDTMAELAAFADTLAAVTSGKDAADAERLASYCRHTIDSAGGVESHSVISRISRIRRPRRTCPDCAERIPQEARVCRFCGYRFDAAST